MPVGRPSIVRTGILLAGVAILVALFVRLGPRELFDLLVRLGWFAAAFPALYAAHHALRTMALSWTIRQRGAVSYWRLLLVRLSGEAVQYLTFTGPLGAEPTRALLLRRQGVTPTEATAATLTEYIAYTWIASLVSFAGLVTLRLLVPLPLPVRIVVSSGAVGAFVVLLLVVLIVTGRRRWIGALVLRVARVPWVARRVAVSPAWVREMEDAFFRNLRDDRQRAAAIVGLEGIAQLLMIVELYWILRLFGVDVTPATILVVEGVNKVSNFVFFFVPARAGTDEATLALVSSTLGMPAIVGLGVSLVRRARSLLAGAAGLAAAWALTREPERG